MPAAAPPISSPLRGPLLLVGAFGVLWIALNTIGGTGGLDPAWVDPEKSRILHDTGWYLRGLFVPACIIVPLAFLVAAITHGWRAAEAATSFAFGSDRPAHVSASVACWGTAARVISWTGLIAGLAAVALLDYAVRIRLQIDRALYYDLLDIGRTWLIRAPLAGLIFGRLFFGGLASAARVRDGVPGRRVFTVAHDVAQLGVAGILWYYMRILTQEI